MFATEFVSVSATESVSELVTEFATVSVSEFVTELVESGLRVSERVAWELTRECPWWESGFWQKSNFFGKKVAFLRESYSEWESDFWRKSDFLVGKWTLAGESLKVGE